MKDEEIKLEEIESSHTLGGYRRCRCYSDVRYTIVNRSHRICRWKHKGLVPKKTHEPVFMWEWVVWSWGGCWCEFYSDVRYTIVNRSHRICHHDQVLVGKKPMDLCGSESEGCDLDCEDEVGPGVNPTLLSDTLWLWSICLTESDSRVSQRQVCLWKTPMDLCVMCMWERWSREGFYYNR